MTRLDASIHVDSDASFQIDGDSTLPIDSDAGGNNVIISNIKKLESAAALNTNDVRRQAAGPSRPQASGFESFVLSGSKSSNPAFSTWRISKKYF